MKYLNQISFLFIILTKKIIFFQYFFHQLDEEIFVTATINDKLLQKRMTSQITSGVHSLDILNICTQSIIEVL